MNEFCEDLKRALNGVSSNHYSQFALKYVPDNGDVGNLKKQEIERVFCYELYFQWKTIISKKPKQYADLLLQGEVSKPHLLSLQDEIEWKTFGLKDFKLNKNLYVPDFVLHKGQESVEFKNQALVVEVKTDNQPSVFDLGKLLNLVNNYNFQIGVFLSVNSTAKDLKESIIGAFDPNHLGEHLADNRDLFNRIVILQKQSASSHTNETNLYKILTYTG